MKYANSSLLQRLVSILDNFELGLAAAKTEGSTLRFIPEWFSFKNN